MYHVIQVTINTAAIKHSNALHQKETKLFSNKTSICFTGHVV